MYSTLIKHKHGPRNRTGKVSKYLILFLVLTNHNLKVKYRLNYMLDISHCILFLLLTGFKPLGPCLTFDGEFAAKAKKVGNCFQLGKCIDSQDLEN